MKRILYAIIALVLVLTVFAVPCFAETVDSTETPSDGVTDTELDGENAQEAPENSLTGSQNDFIAEIIAVVTNGEIWANFGIIASGVVALIVAVTSKFNDIIKGFGAIQDMISGKASKEETKEVIAGAIDSVKTAFDENYTELSDKYARLEQSYNSQTAVLTLLALQLVKSPNARTQIMELLKNTDIAADNVSEVVEVIQAEIKAADEAMPKVDTPALDTIVSEVKAEAVLPVMSLE